MDHSLYLFVYGTLLNNGNKQAVYLKQYGSFYAEGKFRGRLYNIGEYPGAIHDQYSKQFVYGSIFRINHPGFSFNILDDYEGFGDDQPQPNEFIRELIDVNTADGLLKCWVYLYNLPVESIPRIKSGKYF